MNELMAGYEAVTCGSTIKIAFARVPEFRLHSHEVAYGSGSGQQSVTLKRAVDDVNSHWTVVGDLKNGCKRGTPIKSGRIIRLKHAQTDKWLHSHAEFNSPLSNNQEVSAYGGADDSNTADHWKVVVTGGGYWKREHVVRFQHVDTGNYLHSTGQHQFGRPIGGQREVCAYSRANDKNEWTAMEGLYIKSDKPIVKK